MKTEGKSKALAYRLDDETETRLMRAVKKRDKSKFVEILDGVEANYKTVNIIKKQVKTLDLSEQRKWGRELVEMERPVIRVIGAYLLKRTKYFTIDRKYVLDIIDEFCRDDDWNVRQASVDLLEKMVAVGENHEISLMKHMILSDDPYRRRLVLLTSKSIAKTAHYSNELKLKLLKNLEPALAEDDPYVQTVSSETFKEGYMKYCPEMTLNWLEDKLEAKDKMIKSTIVNILGTRYIEERIDKVLHIIDKVLEDDGEDLKRARSTALHILSKNHHDKVSSFLETRMHIQHAVDHWAELEADGTLNSFNI